jgi:hypothetical protein
MVGFGSADVVQSGMQAISSGMRNLGNGLAKQGGLLRQVGGWVGLRAGGWVGGWVGLRAGGWVGEWQAGSTLLAGVQGHVPKRRCGLLLP